MEKKERNSRIKLAVAVVSILGLTGCGTPCLRLKQDLASQRHDLTEARAQLSALERSSKIQQQALSETQSQLAALTHELAEIRKQGPPLSRQTAGLQTKPAVGRAVTAPNFSPKQLHATGPDLPAADSVEGKLSAEGKHWERAEGQPVPGGYVQDILEGRLNQPKGRGTIGKVLFVGPAGNGSTCATVDFGRGCTEGISTSELSPVRLSGPELR